METEKETYISGLEGQKNRLTETDRLSEKSANSKHDALVHRTCCFIVETPNFSSFSGETQITAGSLMKLQSLQFHF